MIVSASARIDAPPDRVYGIIADYRNGHPRIVPKQISDIRVETGGYGAGTIIRFVVTVLGRKVDFRAVVTEPEPGRVLIERNDPPNASVTTFTVEPGPTGRECDVTISTDLPDRRGIAGVIERFLSRRLLQGMYKDELARLSAVAAAPSIPPR